MDEWLTVVITTDLKEGFYLKGRLAGERQGALYTADGKAVLWKTKSQNTPT